MEFRLLGPVEVLREAARFLGGAKPRALLALLLLHANEVVAGDRLIDALWGDRPPGTAGHSLDVQISRLRKAFEPDELLLTRSGGYVLQVEPEQIDVHRFERLLEEGRRANSAGNPAEALKALETALGLWRGAALADLRTRRSRRARSSAWTSSDGRDRGSHRRRARARAARHPDPELEADGEASVARTSARAADARAVPSRQAGGATARLQRRAQAARRGARNRAGVGTQGVGAGDPPPGSGPRSSRPVAETEGVARWPAQERSARRCGRRGRRGPHARGNRDGRGARRPRLDVFLSAESGEVVWEAPVRDTVRVAYDEDALWSVSADGELTRLETESGEIVATLGLGVKPAGLTVGEGSVWVTGRNSPTLFRIDPSVNDIVDRFPLPMKGVVTDGTGEVAFGANSVWVGHGGYDPGAYVERLDPETGRVQHRFSILGGDANHLAFDDGALWVASQASGKLWKIDPRTNKVVLRRQLRQSPCCVAAGGGFVWVAINPDAKVWKVSTDGSVLDIIKLPASIKNVEYAEDALWVAVGEEGTVVRIDPTTNEPRTYDVGN